MADLGTVGLDPEPCIRTVAFRRPIQHSVIAHHESLATCDDPCMGWPFRRRKQWRFEVDHTGVRKMADDTVVESVEWERLVEVGVCTTPGGPWTDDVFFFLLDDGGKGVAIGIGPASEQGVLDRIQALPGFDNETLIEAMGSTADRTFTCWVKDPSP